MSYAEIIPFADGKPQPGVEFRNAWLGAPRIWDALFAAYLPKLHKFDFWGSGPGDRRLLDLATREDIPLFARAVLAFTFDRYYVRNEHFGKFAEDLRSFVHRYPPDAAQVHHLPAWAEWLDKNGGVEAVGLRPSSSSENLWYRPRICPHCGSETGEKEPIPMVEGTEVYDWLESLKER